MTVRLTASDFDGIILDLDGVVTDTPAVHEAAWRRLFEGFLQYRKAPGGAAFRPFSHEDYVAYVDGRSRYEAAEAFLASREITVPRGIANDPTHRETICGLANRKDAYFVELVAARGIRVYEGTVRLVAHLQRRGMQAAVVSGSRHCRMVLAAAGLSALFPVRVDGVDAERLGLAGKPEPSMILEAADRLGIRPGRTILVEDAEAGLEAGRRGGFGMVIGVDRAGGEPMRSRGGGVVIADLREVELDGDVVPSSTAADLGLPDLGRPDEETAAEAEAMG